MASGAARSTSTCFRRFGWIAPVAVIVQALCGLAIYPAYRVHVRAPGTVLPDDGPSIVVLDELPYLMDPDGAFDFAARQPA